MKRALLVPFLFLGFAAWGAGIAIQASFDPADHTVSGTEAIEFAQAPADVYLVLPANLGREPPPHLSGRALDSTYPFGFDPSWTHIEGVTWSDDNGEKELDYELLPFPPVMQTYSLDQGILHVKLPEGMAGTLTIRFRTRFPLTSLGEPGRIGDIYTWRFGWYPILYPAAPEDWESYGFRLPSYRYSLTLSLPEGWAAALPGDKVTREVQGERVRYRVEWERPVRSLSLFLFPEDKVESFTLEGKEFVLEGWYLPGYGEALRALATRALEILSWYGERFGPCPYRRILLVTHPNEVGTSFTADGVAFLSRWYFDRMDLTAAGVLSRVTQFVLAHELAHLWWGIGIGVDFGAENWLSEAFAQYLSISWFEATYGAEGGNVFVPEAKGFGEELLENYLGFVNLREHMVELPYLNATFLGFDEAVVKPFREVKYHNADYERIYDKGYLIVRALADYVGEEGFRKALAEIHDRYFGKELPVDEFRAALEELTGKDLEGFFSQWVTGDAWADYEVASFSTERNGDGTFATEVRLRFRGSGALPVVVRLRGREEGEELDTTWAPSANEDTLTVTTRFRPVEVSVDPDHRVPDVDRLNNHYPRRFVTLLGKNDLPLDAYYLEVLDPGSGAIQGGYLNRFAWAIYPQSRYVAGFVRYGRTGEINAWAQVREDVGLIGAVAWTQYLWGHPDMGIPGGYWQLMGTASFGAFKLPDTAVMPFLDLSWSETVNDVRWGTLSLLYDGEDYRFWASLGKEFHLAPRTYLQLAGGFGRATEGIPDVLAFHLDELFSFRGEGRSKLLAQGALLLPPWEEDYRIGGLLLLTEVLPGAFITAAKLDDGPWVAEGGFVTIAKLEALGGFLTLNAVAGVVYPLLPEPGEGKVFIGISQGF